MRRWFLVLAVLTLFAVACGDDGDVAGESGTANPPSGDDASSDAASPDADLCAVLAEDEPTPEALASLPDEYRDAVIALSSVGDVDLESGSTGDFADALLAPGVGEQLLGLADVAASCGEVETESSLRSFALMTELGSVDADDAYCAALVAEIGDTGSDEVPAELIDLAPPSHAEALSRLNALAEADDVLSVDIFGLFGGLGLYGEAKCGGEGLLGTMMFIAAFAGAFADEDGTFSSSGIDPTTEPTPGDPVAADSALPEGAGFSFVARSIAVEDDGEYVVSVIIPEGWDTDDEGDPFFGIAFDPPPDGDFGFFSEMSFRAGCDGGCAPTDWSERLQDEDGWLTRSREATDYTVDEAIDGGWLVVSDGFAGGVDGTVFLWNDGADRYLECDFSLDEDDVDLVDAFIAACASASPGWFPA